MFSSFLWDLRQTPTNKLKFFDWMFSKANLAICLLSYVYQMCASEILFYGNVTLYIKLMIRHVSSLVKWEWRIMFAKDNCCHGKTHCSQIIVIHSRTVFDVYGDVARKKTAKLNFLKKEYHDRRTLSWNFGLKQA